MSSAKTFYICGMSADADGGIYRYELNEKGKPVQKSFIQVENANYLCYSPDRNYMYASCTMNGSGAVAAFRVEADGSLTFLNKVSSEGLSTCYVICDPSGSYLYCANYSSGSVTEFALKDGKIEGRTRLVVHSGKLGPNAKRQEKPHTHFTNLSPDGKYLIVVDLGLDELKCYPLSAKGMDENNAKTFRVTPPGAGPRHLIFDRSGKIAYLLCELGNLVISLNYEDGVFSTIETKTMLPPDCTVTTKAAAVRLSSDEKFLFASNRGYDSVACYKLDGKGGMEMYDLVLSGGSSPRDINFLPGGRKFATANEFGKTVFFFDFDPVTGKLTPDGNVLELPRPLCIYH